MELETLLQLHLDNPLRKREEKYGLKIAKALHGQIKSSSYFEKRNLNFSINRRVAKGNQNMQQFMDMMRITGDDPYINLDWAAPKIAPQFVEKALAIFLGNEEDVTVEAIDSITLNRKHNERIDALFRMQNQDQIQSKAAATGIPFENGMYTPQTMDELEAWFDECRTPEEVMFEMEGRKTLAFNDYKQLKRTLLRDIIECGMAVVKTWTDPNGNEIIDRKNPGFIVHNLFEKPNGKGEIQYIGEVYSMKIVDARRRYEMDEEEWYKLAQRASINKDNNYIQWSEDFRRCDTRPYDDYSIPVFDFCVKTVDFDFFTVKTDNFGNPNVINKSAKPNPQSERVKPLSRKKYNVYHGVWVVGTETMLEWGLEKNMIRPYQDTQECMFQYSIIIPNNDGEVPVSLIDKSITAIKMLTLTHMKIMQLMAELKPAGAAFDIAKMQDIDLGLGGTVTVQDILRIYNQKGSYFWTSEGDDPNRPRTSPPIIELSNAADVAKLNELVNMHNFWNQKLMDETGMTSILTGGGIKPRMNEASIQQGIEGGTNAISYIYDGFLALMEEAMNKVCIKQWDKIIFNASQYKEYEGYQADLLDMEFMAKVTMQSNKAEKQEMMQLIQIALERDQIDLKDVIKIKEIKNPKLAGIYLGRATENKRKQAAQDAQMNAQMNANAQMQSNQQQAQNTMAMEKQSADISQQSILLTHALQMQLKALEPGVVLPPQAQQLISYVVGKVIKPMVQEDIDESQQQMQQQDQQQAEPQAA